MSEHRESTISEAPATAPLTYENIRAKYLQNPSIERNGLGQFDHLLDSITSSGRNFLKQLHGVIAFLQKMDRSTEESGEFISAIGYSKIGTFLGNFDNKFGQEYEFLDLVKLAGFIRKEGYTPVYYKQAQGDFYDPDLRVARLSMESQDEIYEAMGSQIAPVSNTNTTNKNLSLKERLNLMNDLRSNCNQLSQIIEQTEYLSWQIKAIIKQDADLDLNKFAGFDQLNNSLNDLKGDLEFAEGIFSSF
jgi:hypothetical protein